MKGILILTGNRELNKSLLRFFAYVFNINKENIYYFTFKDSNLISSDVIQNTDLWIVEGFDPENPNNPVGWRTAKKSGKKVIVFFLSPLNTKKRDFFILYDFKNLRRKVEEIIEKEPPSLKDFEEIENVYEILKFEPEHHHHSPSK